MTGSAFAVRIPRDVVRIDGADAASYLQGQLSQDVVRLAVGSCAWTFVLQPQGKVEAWFRITRLAEDAYLCDVEGGWGDALVARLQRFKLRVKVSIEPLDWQCVAVRGVPTADIDADALGAPVAAPVDWAGTVGVDLLGPSVAMPSGIAEGTREQYDAWRIDVAMPAMGAELDESTIPAEAGVVDISVSFTKGCYTGQELVARVDSRGNRTPRKLRTVTAADPSMVLHAGMVLAAADGHEVGTCTTAVGSRALAYVRREVEPPAEVLIAGSPVSVAVAPAH